MQNDPYGERKKLTFAQAEGAEPLPSQLSLREISQELRAKLWLVVHASLEKSLTKQLGMRPTVVSPWRTFLYMLHADREHRMSTCSSHLVGPLVMVPGRTSSVMTDRW